jgi:hypothetical protein
VIALKPAFSAIDSGVPLSSSRTASNRCATGVASRRKMRKPAPDSDGPPAYVALALDGTRARASTESIEPTLMPVPTRFGPIPR